MEMTANDDDDEVTWGGRFGRSNSSMDFVAGQAASSTIKVRSTSNS